MTKLKCPEYVEVRHGNYADGVRLGDLWVRTKVLDVLSEGQPYVLRVKVYDGDVMTVQPKNWRIPVTPQQQPTAFCWPLNDSQDKPNFTAKHKDQTP